MPHVCLLGIGPGDPELITVKAARIMAEADLVYVPQSNDQGRSVAETIIAPYAHTAKLRFACIPMVRDEARLEAVYAALALEIAEHARQGHKVAYVTLGDAMLYSTAHYLAGWLEKNGIDCEYVPGVPSFVAAANRTGVSLAVKKENFLVAAMPDSPAATKHLVSGADTVIFMKLGKRLNALLEYVREERPETAVLVHRLGLAGEGVFNLADGPSLPDEVGYLSIAVIRQGKGRQ